jgi:hypothetical protein
VISVDGALQLLLFLDVVEMYFAVQTGSEEEMRTALTKRNRSYLVAVSLLQI